MSATPPPPNQPPPNQGSPSQPPLPPPMPAYPSPEGRSVSFFVALFLALLLLISGGVNVVLLLFSAIGSPTSMAEAKIQNDDAGYRVVRVGGDKSAKEDSPSILRMRIDGAIAEGASPTMGAAGGTVSKVRRELRFLPVFFPGPQKVLCLHPRSLIPAQPDRRA